jgi:hypothetical protein
MANTGRKFDSADMTKSSSENNRSSALKTTDLSPMYCLPSFASYLKDRETGVIDIDSSSALSGLGTPLSNVNTVRPAPSASVFPLLCKDNFTKQNRKDSRVQTKDTSSYDFDFIPYNDQEVYLKYTFIDTRKK